jgi:hypothetical protein
MPNQGGFSLQQLNTSGLSNSGGTRNNRPTSASSMGKLGTSASHHSNTANQGPPRDELNRFRGKHNWLK